MKTRNGFCLSEFCRSLISIVATSFALLMVIGCATTVSNYCDAPNSPQSAGLTDVSYCQDYAEIAPGSPVPGWQMPSFLMSVVGAQMPRWVSPKSNYCEYTWALAGFSADRDFQFDFMFETFAPDEPSIFPRDFVLAIDLGGSPVALHVRHGRPSKIFAGPVVSSTGPWIDGQYVLTVTRSAGSVSVFLNNRLMVVWKDAGESVVSNAMFHLIRLGGDYELSYVPGMNCSNAGHPGFVIGPVSFRASPSGSSPIAVEDADHLWRRTIVGIRDWAKGFVEYNHDCWQEKSAETNPHCSKILVDMLRKYRRDTAVLATVNGQAIMRREFDRRFEKARADRELTDQEACKLQSSVLGELIDRELLDQEIVRRKLSETPAEAQARLDRIKTTLQFDGTFPELLKSQGMTEAEYRDDLKNKIELARLEKIEQKSTEEILQRLRAEGAVKKFGGPAVEGLVTCAEPVPAVEVSNAVDANPDGAAREGKVCGPEGAEIDRAEKLNGVNLLMNPSGRLTVMYNKVGPDGTGIQISEYEDGWKPKHFIRNYKLSRDSAVIGGKGESHVVMSSVEGKGVFTANSSNSWVISGIPGLPDGSLSAGIDGNNRLQVCSATPGQGPLFHASQLSGKWEVSQLIDKITGPASITVGYDGTTNILFNDWQRGATFLESFLNSWALFSPIEDYGVDQGPPLSLKAHNGALYLSYVITTDYYKNYVLKFATSRAGVEETSIVAENLDGQHSADLTVDPEGWSHIVTCGLKQGRMTYYTNVSGRWAAYPIEGESCSYDSIDTVFASGRVYVAFVESDTRLRIISLNPYNPMERGRNCGQGSGNVVPAAGSQGAVGVADFGRLTVSGSCPFDLIDGQMQLRLGALIGCYERSLQWNPGAAGQITVNASVSSDGKAGDIWFSDDTIHSGELQKCLRVVIRRMRFGNKIDGDCSFKWPITFSLGKKLDVSTD